jgi:hypothetical protein
VSDDLRYAAVGGLPWREGAAVGADYRAALDIEGVLS